MRSIPADDMRVNYSYRKLFLDEDSFSEMRAFLLREERAKEGAKGTGLGPFGILHEFPVQEVNWNCPGRKGYSL